MKTEWDYTDLAEAYLKRPDYATEAIDKMLEISNVLGGGTRNLVCDIGAGAAHLTLLLAKKGLMVHAVEPNDAMRANGIRRTAAYDNVKWYEGIGEHTGQPDNAFSLVTFGSSFNVTNRQEALEESQRILRTGGWFACMWNWRDLSDDIQSDIENIIKSYVKDYSYGTRREDQTDIIRASGRFEDIQSFSGKVVHEVPVEDVIEGWRSHGTLNRQAKEKFPKVIDDIAAFLHGLHREKISVPYETHIWMARVIK